MQEAALKFIALRDALRAQCPGEFKHTVNTELCGRTLALHSAARIDTQAKILGMIATKNTIYSTEQRMYALEPNPLTAFTTPRTPAHRAAMPPHTIFFNPT